MFSLRSLPTPIDSLTLYRARKRIAYLFARTADWTIFIGFVLIVGFGSAWYMVESGTSLTTVHIGPWSRWVSAASAHADPYTRAHFARRAILPLSSDFSHMYVARRDDERKILHSSCHYEIIGRELPGYWWSLTIFDAQGRLIYNPLRRYGFTSDTVTIKPDGSFAIVLARDTRPGNWVPVGGGGRLAVSFMLLDLGTRSLGDDSDAERVLPQIKRVSC